MRGAGSVPWTLLLLLHASVHVDARVRPTPRSALVQRSSQAPAALPTLLRLRGSGGELTMEPRRAWAVLFTATLFELASTGFMHKAEGFSKPVPAALSVLFYGASFYIFNLSLRGIEISVAYSVWSAVVMAALAAIGMTVLGESVSLEKVGGIAAIIGGTMLLARDMSE